MKRNKQKTIEKYFKFLVTLSQKRYGIKSISKFFRAAKLSTELKTVMIKNGLMIKHNDKWRYSVDAEPTMQLAENLLQQVNSKIKSALIKRKAQGELFVDIPIEPAKTKRAYIKKTRTNELPKIPIKKQIALPKNNSLSVMMPSEFTIENLKEKRAILTEDLKIRTEDLKKLDALINSIEYFNEK